MPVSDTLRFMLMIYVNKISLKHRKEMPCFSEILSCFLGGFLQFIEPQLFSTTESFHRYESGVLIHIQADSLVMEDQRLLGI